VKLSAPELLTAAHDVSAFDCGGFPLNDWLKKRALANQAAGASRTYVACQARAVAGYYALAAGSVARADATGSLGRRMPDLIPMMVLGRLAIDAPAQGQGLGTALLRDAVLRVLQAASIVGIRGVLADAIDDTGRAFYEKFGFRRSTAFPQKLIITVDEARRMLSGPIGQP
jgi:GNAT superfamily N-acetyltransferase